ncbi:MAG: DUF3048 domain-containing protein [Clostridia bacterium]|nr:DUF3048 domain-containing protein [Clostridia bacterium]
MSRNGRKSKKKNKLVLFLLLVIVIAGGCLAAKIIIDNQSNGDTKSTAGTDEETLKIEIEKEVPKVKTFAGTDRPIAVMIDNHNQAWPQAGLNQAYMVYEIIVEGGETRLMALFKGQDVEKIGPVRSARHYFIDYVMENDAIYAHYGWSPQAESDVSKFGINNLNGITESTEVFWRVNDKYAPHNAVTSTASLLTRAQAKGYRTTSNKKSVLNYTTDEVNLEEGTIANLVTIPHSTLQTVMYEYDDANKVYKRYARNKEQTDWDTGEPVTTKNIIITFCDNYTLDDGEGKGRQGLYNIGTFDGYYITNGKAIKIKCSKQDRDSQTVYKDLDGNEIKVNDGNTFVNICPKDAEVEIE